MGNAVAGFSKFSKILREAAKNPKVRQAGGQVVDKAAVLAGKATKGKHLDKIERAREEARKRLDRRP